MNEQWKELKETILELRDNDGVSTQQEVCKFLANLMNVLEKQMNSSEKSNEWIPVSERLPEPLEGEYKDYSNWVLVTANLTVDLDRNNNELDVCPAYYCFSEDRWYYINNRRFAADVIIAWKPLPEPYKESEVKQ